MLRFSYFSGYFSNQAEPCQMDSWEEFCDYMRSISNVEGRKPESGERHSLGMISGAIYGDDTKRCNDNVLGWDLVILDVDDGIRDIKEVQNHFDGYDYLIYSSANCTEDKLKLRIILPLHKFAPSDVLSQVWHGFNKWCDGVLDPQTKDKSRMHYLSYKYTNKGALYKHVFIVNKGDKVNWEDLIQKYPSPREADRFKEKNKLSGLKRKIYLQNRSAPSTIIRDRDCPFVYENMIDEYLLTPAGGHHLAIYLFMVKVCYNAIKINYPLSIDELVDMAKQLDELDGAYYDDKKFYDSAKDAIEYTGV